MAEKRFRSVAELRELRKSRVDEDEITVSAGLEHERGGSHGGSGDGSQVAGSAAPSKVARKAKKVGEDGQPAKKVSRKAGSAADTTATETPTNINARRCRSFLSGISLALNYYINYVEFYTQIGFSVFEHVSSLYSIGNDFSLVERQAVIYCSLGVLLYSMQF